MTPSAVRVLVRALALTLVTTLALHPALAMALSSDWVQQPHIQVRLLSSASSAAPGSDLTLGLELKPDPGWHVYWRNPGDSGMPPAINWQPVAGANFGEILWPVPEKIPYGPLVNYGYDHVILPVVVSLAQPPSTADKGSDSVTFTANASWLVCEEFCIPGKASLQLKQPLGKPQAAKEANTINDFVARTPTTIEVIGGQANTAEQLATLELFFASPIFQNAKQLTFFPINEQFLDAASEPELFWKNNFLRITQSLSSDFYTMPEILEGVVVVDHQQAWQFRLKM